MRGIENLATIASLYDEWNVGNLEYVCGLLSPPPYFSEQQCRSLAGMKRTLILLKTLAPDLELAQASSSHSGNQVRDVLAGTGTCIGEELGVTTSGAPIFFTASNVWTFERGRISQVEYQDLEQVLNELLQQGTSGEG